MASQECSKPVTVSHLFDDAKKRGFTQHGELYSVDYMRRLALENISDLRPEILKKLQWFPEKLISALQQGALVLIPYDSDFNHSPCLKKGHKAHWALLVGFISSR